MMLEKYFELFVNLKLMKFFLDFKFEFYLFFVFKKKMLICVYFEVTCYLSNIFDFYEKFGYELFWVIEQFFEVVNVMYKFMRFYFNKYFRFVVQYYVVIVFGYVVMWWNFGMYYLRYLKCLFFDVV